RSLFERLLRRLVRLRVPRPDRDAAEAEPAQDLADRALVQPDREAGLDQGLQVDPAPAHHAVPVGVRPPLHDGFQLGLLPGREPRPRPGPAPVVEAREALLVVAVHPVPERLPVHAGRPRRLLPRGPLQHQRQGEHPPRRPRVPASARLPSQLDRARLLPRDRHRHGPSPPIGYTADQRPRAAHGATRPTVRSRGRWYYFSRMRATLVSFERLVYAIHSRTRRGRSMSDAGRKLNNQCTSL